MKNYLAFLFISIFFLCACEKEETMIDEPTGSNRYQEKVFEQIKVTRAITYGQAVDQRGQTLALQLDFYEPEGDTLTARPLLIYAHGGGFKGGDRESAEQIVSYLVPSGYAVASISYRLVDPDADGEMVKLAVIDAMQDMKAAVRFFNKEEMNYRIDVGNIFVGGYSAGAFTSLHCAYLNTIEELQSYGDQTLLDHVNANGGLEGQSGNQGYAANIKGVINLAGALLQASFVDAGEPILFSGHGTDDRIVPFNEGEADGTGIFTQGSELLHQEADREKVFNKLIAIQGGSHDVFEECQSCLEEIRDFMFRNL